MKSFSLPSLITDLLEYDWGPLLFTKGEGDFVTDAPEDTPLEDCLRIEVWVVKSEQYVYTERNSTSNPWSVPRFGEYSSYPGKIYGQEDLVRGLKPELSGVHDKDIHPLVREWI